MDNIYNLKIIHSGNLVELQHYERIPTYTKARAGRRGSSMSTSVVDNSRKCVYRAIKQIRRLLECNFTNKYQFVTLTFNDDCDFDITDVGKCNSKFNCFKSRLRQWLDENSYPEFQYVGVTEFQDMNHRGAVHYHLFCNLYDITKEQLEVIWKYGFVKSQYVASDAIANEKLVRYLSKQIFDPRLAGKKRYLSSHNLKKPIKLQGMEAVEFIIEMDKQQNYTKLHGDRKESPMFGEVFYEEYYKNPTKRRNQ